jgi:hypothetical protein
LHWAVRRSSEFNHVTQKLMRGLGVVAIENQAARADR